LGPLTPPQQTDRDLNTKCSEECRNKHKAKSLFVSSEYKEALYDMINLTIDMERFQRELSISDTALLYGLQNELYHSFEEFVQYCLSEEEAAEAAEAAEAEAEIESAEEAEEEDLKKTGTDIEKLEKYIHNLRVAVLQEKQAVRAVIEEKAHIEFKEEEEEEEEVEEAIQYIDNLLDEAQRIAAEAEAQRIAAEAEAQRIAAEAEAQRIAAEAEAEAEAQRIADEEAALAEAEAQRIADEADAKAKMEHEALNPRKKQKFPGGGSKLIKGGICSDQMMSNNVEYILEASQKLARCINIHEKYHDFFSSARENIPLIIDVCNDDDLFNTNMPITTPGMSRDLNTLLEEMYENKQCNEWFPTSKTFYHMLQKCPQQLANCMMFKYEQVYLNGNSVFYDKLYKNPVEDERIPFIVGIQGDNDDEESSGVASSGGASSSASQIKYYICIGSDFLPLQKFYKKSDMRIGSQDAPSNNGLKLPLCSDPLRTDNLVNTSGESVPIRIYGRQSEETEPISPHSAFTIAQFMDPAGGPAISPYNLNTSPIFERRELFEECDIGLSDRTQNPIYFAFAQMLLHPNASFARYFTNLAIDLFNKTFFELFGSTSRIVRPADDGAVELFQVIDSFVRFVDGKLLNETTFHEFFDTLKSTQSTQPPLLLLQESLGGNNDFGISSTKDPYRYCQLEIQIATAKPRRVNIHMNDFSVSSIANSVNFFREGKPISNQQSHDRLVALAEAIYAGIVQGSLPEDLKGTKGYNRLISLIITSFKARGDGNQVALLALITAAVDRLLASLDPSVVGISAVLRALKILVSKIFTNDKNTVVQSLILEKDVIKAGGGCRTDGITLDDYRRADDPTKRFICCLFPKLTEKMLIDGNPPSAEDLNAHDFSELETLKVLLVSMPKGNPADMIYASVNHILESLEKQPTLPPLSSSSSKEQNSRIGRLTSDSPQSYFAFKKQFSDPLLRSDIDLKILHEELFKAKNVYDVLSGHTVEILQQLEHILRRDIQKLRLIIPPSKLGKLTPANFELIQMNIQRHMQGKKLEVLNEAIEKAEDIFHLPPDCVQRIEDMINLQSEVQTELIKLDTAFTMAQKQREASIRTLPPRSSKQGLSFREESEAKLQRKETLEQEEAALQISFDEAKQSREEFEQRLKDVLVAKQKRVGLMKQIKDFKSVTPKNKNQVETLKNSLETCLEEIAQEKDIKKELREKKKEEAIANAHLKSIQTKKVKLEIKTEAERLAVTQTPTQVVENIFTSIVKTVTGSSAFNILKQTISRVSSVTFGGGQRTALNNRHRIYTKKRITRKKRRQPNRKTKTKSSNQRRITSKMASARRYHKRGYTHKK
jgi:hypothetical protein